ncbi:uncharacterized protein BDV14DRAFT_162048 [Aspergillus stella-maris]|uniref:uncharacterized protein n=1 Tax=Aspergillus stella-maris TaxID=1810926 RepID=UPI003CCD14F4
MSLYSPLRIVQSSLRRPYDCSSPRTSLRYVSINSAIGYGIRASQSLDDRRESYDKRRRPRSGDTPFKSRNIRNKDENHDKFSPSDFDELQPARRGDFSGLPREYQRHRSQNLRRSREENIPYRPDSSRISNHVSKFGARGGLRGDRVGREAKPVEFDPDEFVRTGTFAPWQLDPESEKPKRFKRVRGANAHRYTDEMPERAKEFSKPPSHIPFTHAASEFVFGIRNVEAAVRCGTRKLYKLYMYMTKDEPLSPRKIALRKLALSKNIQVKMVFGYWDTLFGKLSGARAHNGVLIEASPLPKTPTLALKPFALGDDTFGLELAPQSREEAAVNGTKDRFPLIRPFHQQHTRYPIVLLLSGITDTGNVGAIIRSAYYLGVDAIVFAGPNCAPLNPATIRTSVGAAENMNFLSVRNEVDFIQRSRANGWRFYHADAVSPAATYADSGSIHSNQPTATTSAPGKGEGVIDYQFPINQAPSVIMLGSEALGLSSHIKSHADAVVSIPAARYSYMGDWSDPAGVDSLNVAVAAAVLIQMFMNGPVGLGPVRTGFKPIPKKDILKKEEKDVHSS